MKINRKGSFYAVRSEYAYKIQKSLDYKHNYLYGNSRLAL